MTGNVGAGPSILKGGVPHNMKVWVCYHALTASQHAPKTNYRTVMRFGVLMENDDTLITH